MSKKTLDTEKEEQLKLESIHFYKLNKKKPYSVEGTSSKDINFFIPFSIAFLLMDVVIFGVNGYYSFQEIVPIFLFLGFLLVGIGILAYGIHFRRVKRRCGEDEQKIIENCNLTDGKIIAYQCKEVRKSYANNRIRIYYDVHMVYGFYDLDFKYREASYHHIYSQDPQFFKGQYLMIAFTEEQSLILNTYTLSSEDQARLEEAEVARMEHQFDDVTGQLEQVDLKKYKSGENIVVHVVVVIVAFLWMLLYGMLIGFLAIRHILETNWLSMIIVAIVFALVIPLLVFSIPLLWGIVTSISRIHRFRQVFKDDTIYYTYGKLFASRKTYSQKSRKEILYYYVDYLKNSHSKICKSYLRYKDMEDDIQKVLVAYNSRGDSIVLVRKGTY
ncbi:MAG: hypothetical protein K2K15_02435 [Anaeroplasmataceae bacterium]|nr:hypothetical protein [Anaeroplasmataceae bacterium]